MHALKCFALFAVTILLVGCNDAGGPRGDVANTPDPQAGGDPYSTASAGHDDETPSPGEMEAAAAARTAAQGKLAPSFTLPDYQDERVSLSDYRGQWVVLYFYPKNDTPGCTCQATEFTELLADFRDMNAAVLGVSEDTPDSHRHFREKYELKLRLLSDPDHDVMDRYGAWVDTPWGERVLRTTYIIGPEGRIRHHWPEVIPEGHAERVKEKLAELQQQA
jgi:peroxiredoxin Q/BCP